MVGSKFDGDVGFRENAWESLSRRGSLSSDPVIPKFGQYEGSCSQRFPFILLIGRLLPWLPQKYLWKIEGCLL